MQNLRFDNSLYSAEQKIFTSVFSLERTKTQQIVEAVFKKLSTLFDLFTSERKSVNLKTLATISCLSLVALLFISMFRLHHKPKLIPPPTPLKNPGNFDDHFSP